MSKTNLFVVATVLAGLFAASEVHATSVSAFGDDVSIWNSGVTPDIPGGIFPVQGSGQQNGEFVTSTYVGATFGDISAVQIGLRAQERFGGPTLPRNDNIYYAKPGTSGTSTVGARWNYDLHLDFGTEYLQTQLRDRGLIGNTETLDPLNMRYFEVVFEMDLDPTAGTNFVSTDLNQLATDLATSINISIPLILLSQTSQNMFFDVLGGGPDVFDPNQKGIYDFRLSVVDTSVPNAPHTVVEAEMQVVVVPLPAAMWMGFVLLGGVGVVRGIRRLVGQKTADLPQRLVTCHAGRLTAVRFFCATRCLNPSSHNNPQTRACMRRTDRDASSHVHWVKWYVTLI